MREEKKTTDTEALTIIFVVPTTKALWRIFNKSLVIFTIRNVIKSVLFYFFSENNRFFTMSTWRGDDRGLQDKCNGLNSDSYRDRFSRSRSEKKI